VKMKCSKVLIVDDSRTMRMLIAETLSRDPKINIVGEAADPYEARDAIKLLDPDVVTLDIEMPKMNGLDFLERIMRLRPTRVIVVSTLTERGAATTIRALELGAMDCVAKPSIKDPSSFDDLSNKIHAAAAAPLRQRPAAQQSARAASGAYESDGRIVALGASMGGVEALLTLLSSFPENCPPTVVTQHMPAFFTKSFAARLDKLCQPKVIEAYDGAPLRKGQVLIAPGGPTHLEISASGGPHCQLTAGDLVSGHRPSIDVMFRSVAQKCGRKSLGAILTGMGRDGAEGLLAMHQAGAATFGQDQASSVVYGMPRAAFELGAVEQQLPLDEIGPRIIRATNMVKAR
jgi:two-component system chemotaxis response regulator CheB